MIRKLEIPLLRDIGKRTYIITTRAPEVTS
jgi:hypothetical protein